MRAGAIDGLSIGYRTVRGVIDPRTRVRRLYQVDLWEISIVTFPLLHGARVSAVKQQPGSPQRAKAERDWRSLSQIPPSNPSNHSRMEGLEKQGLASAADAPAQVRRRGGAATITLRTRADRKRALGGVALRRFVRTGWLSAGRGSRERTE